MSTTLARLTNSSPLNPTLRPFLCGHDWRNGIGFQRRFAAEDGSRDESNDKADGQRLDEGIGHVDDRILVELRRALYRSDVRGDGGRV